MLHLNHIHMVGKVLVKNPPKTTQQADDWLRSLVDKINMNILVGPFSVKCDTIGNEGITGAVVIETSHCSIHFWDNVENPFGMFDVYSCVQFDHNSVLDHLHECFDVVECKYMIIDRNDDIQVLQNQLWTPTK